VPLAEVRHVASERLAEVVRPTWSGAEVPRPRRPARGRFLAPASHASQRPPIARRKAPLHPCPVAVLSATVVAKRRTAAVRSVDVSHIADAVAVQAPAHQKWALLSHIPPRRPLTRRFGVVRCDAPWASVPVRGTRAEANNPRDKAADDSAASATGYCASCSTVGRGFLTKDRRVALRCTNYRRGYGGPPYDHAEMAIFVSGIR
jgi:hypothetical protein